MSVTTDSLNVQRTMVKRRLHILTFLRYQPLWKRRVAQRMDETPQTIGRDIDALHQDGLLETTLMEADDVNRTHLIAYQTTTAGEHAIDHYRVCTSCGHLVDTEAGCVHEYVPLTDANTPGVLTE